MIKIKKTKILSKIFLLEFEDNISLGSTFLRFQEYYESPKFKGKIFTYEEFKEWYSKTKNNEFTYYNDWSGFNIPSYILKPFFEEKFNPLSDNEKQILDLFKEEFEKEKNEFYIIGVSEKSKHLLDHEIMHGLYYTNKNYKNKITKILSRYDTNGIKDEIRKTGGYAEEVLDDEVHAWMLDIPQELKCEINPELVKEIKKVFDEYKKE